MNSKLSMIIKKFRISGSAFFDAKLINGSFGVKAKGLLVGIFARMLPAIGLGTTKFRLSIIVYLIRRFSEIHKTQGMRGLILHLKAVTVILQQSLMGFVLSDMTALGPRVKRTGSGIPRLVARQDRALIAVGNTTLMRFYLTVFNLYRILEMLGALKLGTIVDGFKGNLSRTALKLQVLRMIPHFVKMIKSLAGDKLQLQGLDPRVIVKSAPGTAGKLISSSPLILLMSAWNLKEAGLDQVIMYFGTFFAKNSKVSYPGFVSIFREACDTAFNLGLPSSKFGLGKLGFKEEAAGKVRVFAMVDGWTQWVLEPLHREIFRILKFLPADGTFDQVRPVLNYQAWPSAYSLDLTAATDRLPLFLQIKLLTSFYGEEFALNWARLLVDRDYTYSYKGQSGSVRYAVGQPMGALSSWAMLALTHHFIVTVAAWLSGATPVGSLYSNYAVLGDDLVVGDRVVKDKYLAILDALGVQCGLHKSVLSSNGIGIEFAKRTFYKGVDVSPIPLTEFIAANLTLPSALAFAAKYKLSFPALVKSLGFGYKVLGSLNKHVGLLNARVRALLLGYHAPVTGTSADVVAFLKLGTPMNKELNAEIFTLFSEEVVARILAKISSSQKTVLSSVIKHHVDQEVNTFWARYGEVYLRGLLSKEVTETSVSVDLDPGRTFVDIPSIGTITLPPHIFNRVESDLRGLRLLLTNIYSMLLNETFDENRTKLRKLRRPLERVQHDMTIGASYQDALEALRAFNNVSEVKVDLVREDEEDSRLSFDLSTIKLWRTFSGILLKAAVKAKAGPVSGPGGYSILDESPGAIFARAKAYRAKLPSRFL